MFYVLIYLSEIVGKVINFFGWGGGVTLVGVLIYAFFCGMEDERFRFKIGIPLTLFGIISIFICAMLPTKESIYKIAIGGYVLENGSKALTTLAESDIPSDMKDIVTMEIKKYKNNLTAEFKKTESDSL